MGRTFEALVRAEKESRLKREELVPFDPRVTLRPYAPVPLSVSQQLSEEYQGLKHTLRSLLPEGKSKVLMFVSSTHGEGTSTIVATFATVLASSGESVLLVDANLRKPSLHDMFGLERIRGFSDLLLGSVQMKDVMKGTRVGNLLVVTGGTPSSNPAMALGPEKVYSVIHGMSTQADWVILDTPPINEFSDAMALGPEVDGTVLVVQAEKTRSEVALRAKQRLEDAHLNVLGVVLNKRKYYVPEWLYRRL
jgi:capsular exopolysaccharide synthesis family protein